MTRLIVISNETNIDNETGIVNDLFRAGLGLFHLRKPQFTLEQQRSFLTGIEKHFHNRISVHQNYETVVEFDLKYYHVRERDRTAVTLSSSKGLPGALRQAQRDKVTIKKSTSFHNYNDLQFESHNWDYCFFGPLFNSISKPGYNSKLEKGFHNEGDLYQRVYALGGITSENINEVFEKEFFGAAVLGSIWKDPGNAIKNFELLNKLCKQHVHTF